MGIVVEIFDDLNVDNPWVRVLFTHPKKNYQWCKMSGLSIVTKGKEGADPPFRGANESGSL